MDLLGFFKVVAFSFFSSELYKRVCASWGKRVFKYLFILLFFITLFHQSFWYKKIIDIDIEKITRIEQTLAHNQEVDLSRGEADINLFLAYIVSQIPEVTIKNGQVVTQIKQPYKIYTPSNQTFIVIDTSGATKDSDIGSGILITKDQFAINFGGNTSHFDINELTKNHEVIVSKVLILEAIGSLKTTLLWAFVLILLPTTIVLACVGAALQALIYGLFGFAYCHFKKIKIKFLSIYGVSLVSQTPSIIIGAFLPYLSISGGTMNTINFGISVVYFFFAMNSITERASKN